MIMFSLVGTNPPFANVETVKNTEKVRGEMSLELRTSLAVLIKFTYTRTNREPTRCVMTW